MTDIQFLGTASEIALQIRTLLSSHVSNTPIQIAVAFWGHGADEIIACSNNRYQIICNLKSGGTNPAVVRTIARQPNVSIRQIDTLHAKVIISDNGTLISSANLSTNGLALEGVNSQTWNEAGVALPISSLESAKIIDWFTRLWVQSVAITESDLNDADQVWANRRAMLDNSDPNLSQDTKVENDGLTPLRTVEFSGRAPMKQVYLRSAATFVALHGTAGECMPSSAFKFLFTSRAFKNQEAKFEYPSSNTLKLKKDFIGYFVSSDSSISATTAPGRLKSFTDETIYSVAQWMLCRGTRPDQLEGNIVEARFLLS